MDAGPRSFECLSESCDTPSVCSGPGAGEENCGALSGHELVTEEFGGRVEIVAIEADAFVVDRLDSTDELFGRVGHPKCVCAGEPMEDNQVPSRL